jgi:hypothetical protein
LISFAVAQFKKSVLRFSLDDVESGIIGFVTPPPPAVEVVSIADGEIEGHRRLTV